MISFVLDPPALVALANAAVFDRGVAPTWPMIAAGQDPLSVASLRLSTTELSPVNHPQALGRTHARSVDLPHAETDKRTRVIRSDGEFWDRNYAAADQDQWY